uniref:Uncharacterized protein n=1 Tax=Zonotrichia albicollis TaxID=44394 RepID=A0A8D2MPF3_ZONAL
LHLVKINFERVMFDKITSRIQKLCYGLNADFVDPVSAIPCLTPPLLGRSSCGVPGWLWGFLGVPSCSGCSVIP